MNPIKVPPLRILSLVTALVPIVISLMLALFAAERYSLASSRVYAEFLAEEVLERAVTYARQGWGAIQELEAAGSPEPCSDANINRMQKLTVSAPYLLIPGYVEHDHLLCSSLGRHSPGIPVGTPAMLTEHGVYLRPHLHLPAIAGTPYALTTHASTGYSTLVLRDWPVTVSRRHPDITLGLYIFSQHQPLAVQGDFVPDWNELSGRSADNPLFDNLGVVAIRRAPEYDFASVVHLPPSYVHQEWRRAAKWLVPVGLVVGLLMAWLSLLVLQKDRGLIGQLKRALRNDAELYLVYLPIVDLATGRWVGAEALLRWRKLDGTPIGPDLFIPAAEHAGIIGQVTDKVLTLLAEDATTLLKQHPQLHIAFNLSASDLLSPQIVPKIRALIDRMNIEPRNLQVEATERVMLDATAVRSHLIELRQLGVHVSIDDFGTGYSSLAYLTELEVDSLKIDKCFVETIGTEAVTSQVVEHVIRMARALNLDTIAEGVETPEQAAYLHQHGVPYAQGWLYSRPLQAQALLQALDAQAAAARAAPEG